MNKQNTTDFGFKEVPVADKESFVAGVFSSVANKYDVMNDVMSLGIHRLWKKHLIDIACVTEGEHVLDLAGGTGDLAIAFSKQVGESGNVVLSDINAAMLAEGKKRLMDNGAIHNVDIVEANAEALPFDDNRFDTVTMAFGLRNVTHKEKALTEIYRCLKPSGQCLVLEFSKPTNAQFEKIYDTYSFNAIPKMGEWITGDSDSYQYLVESIRKHPDQETLLTMVKQAGFRIADYQNLTGGIVAIHRGIK